MDKTERNTNRIYVSDIIKEDYKLWDKTDNIIIDCMTGEGKTYFVINVYAKYLATQNKNMLILSNRNKLKEDLKLATDGIKNITVMNYQALQKLILKGKEIQDYDCIVCDEAHYFISDSWNKSTDVAWKHVIKNDCIRVFMSATGWDVFGMVKKAKNKLYEYKTKRDYSYVEKVIFYKENDYVVNTLKSLPTQDKAIYFSNSKKRGYETYLLFKNEEGKASYLCSTGDKEYKDKITKDAIVDEKFESQILIATSCIDNGINLKDRNIKHIFIDIVDVPILLQCLGRKRILDENDTVTFHIKAHTKKQLNRFINKDKGKIEIAEAYLKKDDVLLSKLVADRDSLLRDCFSGNYITGKLDFNPMRYIGLLNYISTLETCVNDGFDNVILSHLEGVSDDKIEYPEVEGRLNRLEIYLDGLIGEKLYKKDQSQLAELINVKKNGRLLKSIAAVIAGIDDEKLPYTIVANTDWDRKLEDGSKNIMYGKVYWMVIEKIA